MVSKAEKRARAQAKLEAATKTTTEAKPAAAPTTEAKPAATTTPKVVTKVVGVLKVKKEGISLRGARAAWYERLKEFDGKPAQDYLEDTTKNPPSLPKSGKQEPSSGWFRWFIRHDVATIVQEPKNA